MKRKRNSHPLALQFQNKAQDNETELELDRQGLALID
ncbi:uncharacterized protein G2W53_007458 [Senna tora]|uniref:Uncharacterized protein n=1 Tax=Senna tora TaxID=362788 RepID=A0A835CDP1_9FABA|nr:uncharacterized protein G2W53_007458 [Senna tora]